MLWNVVQNATSGGLLSLQKLRESFNKKTSEGRREIRKEFLDALERLDTPEVRCVYDDVCELPSDDGYDYFRAAVISYGETKFYSILNDAAVAAALANQECEELYEIFGLDGGCEGESDDDSGDSDSYVFFGGSHEGLYPVEPGRYPLDTASFVAPLSDDEIMWIRAEVQDSTSSHHYDFAYKGGTFRMYPQAEVFWKEVSEAAESIQAELEGMVDYRKILGECVHIIIRLSDIEAAPRQAYGTPSTGPFWLAPGIIVEESKGRILDASDDELTARAKKIIRESIATYFASSNGVIAAIESLE